MSTSPNTCERCGAALDAGEICDCAVTEEAASMEFVMRTDLSKELPASIDFNFEALKAGLSESLTHYNNLVVTKDTIQAAKADRARLNALREALESKRREVKKECLAPYTAFETKVKELTALIAQPIAAIDSQLDVYEQARREKKREEIVAIYGEIVGDLAEIVPFEAVWKSNYYNVGMTAKKIRTEMEAFFAQVRSDLDALQSVKSNLLPAVKATYVKNFSLSEALAEANRLEVNAQKMAAYEAAKTWEAGGGASVEEPHYRLRFECTVTEQQAKELSAWLTQHDIPFGRIK